MFRLSVLSIVLSLALGQNVALLCRTWCDAEATAGECSHENSFATRTVASSDDCDNGVLVVSAVLSEDGRIGASSPAASQAIPVPRYQLAQLTFERHAAQAPWREWSPWKHPLLTTLRI